MDAIIAKCYGTVNSNSRVPRRSRLLFNARMDAHDARRANLLDLIARYGTIEKLAEATGSSASHLSQVKNSERQLGKKVARRIETKLDLPKGWMDNREHGAVQGSIGAAKLVQDFETLPPLLQDYVAKIASELRERIEKIPEAYRSAISAPPEHDPVRYREWERGIVALAFQFEQQSQQRPS